MTPLLMATLTVRSLPACPRCSLFRSAHPESPVLLRARGPLRAALRSYRRRVQLRAPGRSRRLPGSPWRTGSRC